MSSRTAASEKVEARLPHALADSVRRYAAQHRCSVSDLLKEALEMRLEQDPLARVPVTPDLRDELRQLVREEVRQSVREELAAVCPAPAPGEPLHAELPHLVADALRAELPHLVTDVLREELTPLVREALRTGRPARQGAHHATRS